MNRQDIGVGLKIERIRNEFNRLHRLASGGPGCRAVDRDGIRRIFFRNGMPVQVNNIAVGIGDLQIQLVDEYRVNHIKRVTDEECMAVIRKGDLRGEVTAGYAVFAHDNARYFAFA